MSFNSSLLLALLLILFTLTAILYVAWHFNRTVPGLRDWFFAFFIGLANLLIFFAEPPLPKIIMVLINQSALMGVGLLALKACYLHTGTQFQHLKVVSIAIGLALLAITYLTVIEPNQPLRYFIGSVVSGALFVTAGIRFTKDRFKSSPIQFFFGLSLIAHGAFNCLRIALFQPPIAESLKAFLLSSTDVILYEQLFISTLFALGIIMLVNESISKQLRIQAQYDGLTNLFNRRVFLDLLSKNKSLSIRIKSSSSLLMIDIDHFKSINDQYGHQIGDQVLIDFANRTKQNLREEDIIARMGGEEFAILLPNTNKESALHFAERLRAIFEASPAKTSGNDIFYTISIGVVTPDEFMTIDEALHASDLAMYEAKRAGRNQVKYCLISTRPIQIEK